MRPYPPSFGNDPILYAWSLGSITTIAFLMMMVCGWMAREIWRDRYHVHPKTTLTAFRVILMLAAATGFLRAMPEAVYMFAWNEVSPGSMQLILLFKRLADSLASGPGTGWVILLIVSYPAIANTLKSSVDRRWAGDLLAPWPKVVRPIFGLVLIFTIAFLVAVSKLYLGSARA